MLSKSENFIALCFSLKQKANSSSDFDFLTGIAAAVGVVGTSAVVLY
jgi:hypothetical protein